MKISWKHLSKLVDLEGISIKEATTKLTLAGLEVDSITNIDKTKDIVFNINITANRQDLVGWAQIAVELSAALEQPLIIENQLDHIHFTNINKNNKSSKLLSEAYACIVIDSNDSLKKRDENLANELEALGLSSTGSLILDAVNFINLKWGQSISVHKLKQASNEEIKKLTIKVDNKTEKQKYELKAWINHEELNHITEGNINDLNRLTNTLLINYNNKKNNKKNNKNYCINAYLDILSLVKSKNKKQFLSIYYKNKCKKVNQINQYIDCSEKDISCLLGPVRFNDKKQRMSLQTIFTIAQSLSLHSEYIDGGLRIHIPPARRNDITRKADLAEEIARIYGFNNFYDNLPQFNKINLKSKIATTQQIIRKILRSMGLHEIINYSFQSRGEKNNRLHIVNSLSKDQTSLRSNIISGIIEAKKYNTNQGNSSLEAFELGSVFNKSILSKQYKELTHLSWVIGNKDFNKSSWRSPRTPLTWLQAKGHAEELFERLNAQIAWTVLKENNEFTKSLESYIHPTKSIYIKYKDQTIGVLSQLNTCNYSISSASYFAEIKLDQLIQSIKPKSNLSYLYNHYSSYPRISRDFSITISKKISMGSINDTIARIEKEEENRIESVILLSEYYNSRDKKTICLRINYRSKNKTLTSQEIKILDDILKSKLTSALE